ncbi:hypothetical protein AAL_01167 [Moelleriella libera RCEF 2490]|uniref:Armadillo-like helical domain-containing protein n=1 Tax=Moelleriella libera RCEF 2490 TaxID=1081109 RepID=A0A166VIH6_9HYPO|nr:hypothetical protein AAL_01167 [Moelleriella libera RCEF 2490]
MEISPLTRQPTPEAFTPKIAELYAALFKGDYNGEDKSEGFWTEFFLLKPDRQRLQVLFNEIPPADVLLLEGRTRELFGNAVVFVKEGQGLALSHALDTLTIFFSCLLSKRYPHPSSDIISIVAGLDQIDAVFTNFVSVLDTIVRSGRSLAVRHQAVNVLLAVTAGAYRTTLLTYMIQRDLFPALMKFVQDSDTPGHVLKPFTLLGLLANYNKFEFQNPYQLRLNDFVNEPTIQKIIRCIGYTCQALRLDYIDVQDDAPEGWTLANTLNLIGLGLMIRGPKPEKKTQYDEETAKRLFSQLPGGSAAILLATYDFAHANKLFCFNLVSLSEERSNLKDLTHINTLLDHVVNLLALSLSAGEAFLPSPAAYDDLFYKIVESGEVLARFKEKYMLQNRKSNSIDTLINVSTHYNQLLTDGGASAKKRPSYLTTYQVTEVIKQGYESLSIQATEGLDNWDAFREADERTLLKQMARTTVEDVRSMTEQGV